MSPGPPQGTSCCTHLESIFRNVTKNTSEWGRCFCCDGGITSYALELVPIIRGELQLPAWHQVCCTFPSGLLGRMLQSYPPRDEGRGCDGSGTGSPHHAPGIRLDLSAPISTRSSTYCRRDKRSRNRVHLRPVSTGGKLGPHSIGTILGPELPVLWSYSVG
jgi:hypothetical protein